MLLFSNYCSYSEKFLEALYQNEDIFNSFIRVNIDVVKETHKRPDIFYQIQDTLNYKIDEVPTIIVEDGQYVLSGTEAFKWLEHYLNQDSQVETTNGEMLEAFNPIEMFSFSDSYAKIDSNDMNDASNQSFQFINSKEQRIMTPQEDSSNAPSDQDYSNFEKERESLLRNDNKPDNKSKVIMNKQNSVGDISSNMGNIGKQFDNKNNNVNLKKREVDLKYQELLQQRDQSVPKQPRNNVDFASGTVKQY